MFDDRIFQWYTEKQLKYLAFGKRRLYIKKKIPKKNGGMRELLIPIYKLKVLQKRILNDILYEKQGVLSQSVTGFVKGGSILDNARHHVWRKYILKIDIKDFFDSISQDRVFGLFQNTFWYNKEKCKYLSGICCYKNRLPQGSPASPMLANLIARWVDYRIDWLLRKIHSRFDVSYSRYADDLCFSFWQKMNFHKFIQTIVDILISEWFFPNYEKIHLFSRWKQQAVTGIIVNEKVNYGRKKYAIIKALLYNIQKNWLTQERERWNELRWAHIEKNEDFAKIILWHLAFVQQVNTDYYRNLLNILPLARLRNIDS